jgi:hypothetical protein
MELRNLGGKIDIGAQMTREKIAGFLGAEWNVAEKLKVFADLEVSRPARNGKTNYSALGGVRVTW